MKKIIITSILSSLICVASFGQSLYRTILSHNGQLSQYNINHWTDAITDAVEGDTVYFTPGYFPGSATITSKITLIGAGEIEVVTGTDETTGNPITETQKTTIGGSFVVDIDGEPTLSTWMFEGFHINDNIHISKPVKGLKIKRCYVEDNLEAESIETLCTNMTVESCTFGRVYCGFLVSPDIHNCYIDNLASESTVHSFVNCSIRNSEYSTGCTFLNCIVYDNYYDGSNVYSYCVYRDDRSDIGSTYTNCYRKPEYSFAGGLTKEELQTAGYIGNDGNVVGHLGGTAPYTLIPSQPYVSASTVAYDASNNKLNVNITVKKGK